VLPKINHHHQNKIVQCWAEPKILVWWYLSEHSIDLKDDSSARPSRAIDPAQYSSTSKDKKSGRNKERLKLHQEVSQFAVEVALKVPNLEVSDTLRVKEAELELRGSSRSPRRGGA